MQYCISRPNGIIGEIALVIPTVRFFVEPFSGPREIVLKPCSEPVVVVLEALTQATRSFF